MLNLFILIYLGGDCVTLMKHFTGVRTMKVLVPLAYALGVSFGNKLTVNDLGSVLLICSK
jgi:hypothetical protein